MSFKPYSFHLTPCSVGCISLQFSSRKQLNEEIKYKEINRKQVKKKSFIYKQK